MKKYVNISSRQCLYNIFTHTLYLPVVPNSNQTIHHSEPAKCKYHGVIRYNNNDNHCVNMS